ncbi:hypothetical protein O181_106372 [Austropuccinia psidii MF-1]|uniref:Uncharacterized protein n=1 Tax=Austropuccinia psidii MF-1 TaxID=1389203 RepID=A0A9Q3JRY0_9BASI|nr:hypothetical protein [Austropuccinia psidii MF-1]
MELDTEVELIPHKGEGRETQGKSITQRKVPEMPIISEPELELIKSLLHSVQRQGLGNVAASPPTSDELLAHPEKIPQRRQNSEILQWMECTIVQASNQKDKRVPCQKEGGKKGRTPSSFYQQASSQPTSSIREEEQEQELEETIFPKLQDRKNTKRSHGECFQNVQNLVEFKDKEEQRMRQPNFQKK